MSHASIVAAIEYFRARLTPAGEQRYIELRDWIAAESSRGDDLLSTNYELVKHVARHHAADSDRAEVEAVLRAAEEPAPSLRRASITRVRTPSRSPTRHRKGRSRTRTARL